MPSEMAPDLFDLRAVAAGHWSAAGVERFRQPDGSQFGGYLMGLMLAAVLREPESHGQPVALTGVFLGKTGVGELAVTTEVLRAGKSLQTWRAGIVQAEMPCVQATITFAERPNEGPSFGWLLPPAAPPPETLERPVYPPQAPAWLKSFDQRQVNHPRRDASDGVSLIWARDPQGGPLDYPRLAMFADMFPPRSNMALGHFTAASTVSNSIYFHARPDEVEGAGDDFVLLHGSGRRGAHGICDLTAAIWRRDGRLLATTEQLCWFR